MKKIQEGKIKDKNILIRLDLDVSFESKWKNGNYPKIIDDQRLKTSIQTINYLLENNASKITIIGHLDRPQGIDFQKSLWPVANRIADFLGYKSCFTKPEQNYALDEKIIIFDNLRFNPGEEENNREFAQELAQGQDIFVQDAFASCHRNHASTVAIAKLLPSYAGFSVQKEVQNLSKILQTSEEGFTIIIGGKKTQDKLPVIENLLDKAEYFLIGGIIANTFLASRGYNLGKTLIENEIFPKAREIIQSGKLTLPKDLIFSDSYKDSIEPKIFSLKKLANIDNLSAVDIGPETVASFQTIIKKSKTIFWNGNMGISEIDKFASGTEEIAKAIVSSSAKKYAGGGDTSTFIHEQKLESNFDFISLAGGATLNFLAGKKLPGLEVLEKY